MRQQVCLPLIIYQQDITISQKQCKHQQTEAKPKNCRKVREESVEAI